MCLFEDTREFFGDLTAIPPQPYIGIYAFRRGWGKLIRKLPKSPLKIHIGKASFKFFKSRSKKIDDYSRLSYAGAKIAVDKIGKVREIKSLKIKADHHWSKRKIFYDHPHPFLLAFSLFIDNNYQ